MLPQAVRTSKIDQVLRARSPRRFLRIDSNRRFTAGSIPTHSSAVEIQALARSMFANRIRTRNATRMVNAIAPRPHQAACS